MPRKLKGKGQTHAERQLWLATTQAGKKYWGDMVQAERAQKGSGIIDTILKIKKAADESTPSDEQKAIRAAIGRQYGFGKKQNGGSVKEKAKKVAKVAGITTASIVGSVLVPVLTEALFNVATGRATPQEQKTHLKNFANNIYHMRDPDY